LKGGDQMISLLFGVGLGELIWRSVQSGRRTVKQAKNFVWFFIALNFTLALAVDSLGNLEMAIILSNYAIVIYDIRGNKL